HIDRGAFLFGGVDRAGDRHFVHHQLAPPGVALGFQYAHGGLAARVVGVVHVIGPGQQHFARAYIAAEIVDVAVGLVVEQAIRQPDHFVHAQVLGEYLLDLLAGEVRVAVLVEQAFPGGDQGAFAIDVDRAAFQHEAFGAVARAALDLEDLAGHLIVALPGPVQAAVEAAPGVEGPVHAANRAAGV